jgi:hypothetical protein
MADRRLAKLYMLNLALLATHEIDSAYWHEWEMFHLPGGVQGFLAAGFPQFRNMVSPGLLIAIFLVSIAQLVMLRCPLSTSEI